MSTADRIRSTLTNRFSPTSIEVIDESHLHHGHAGWREGGQTHFRVKIESPLFSGRSRLDRHRMINDALDEELRGGVHALAIAARAPGE